MTFRAIVAVHTAAHDSPNVRQVMNSDEYNSSQPRVYSTQGGVVCMGGGVGCSCAERQYIHLFEVLFEIL